MSRNSKSLFLYFILAVFLVGFILVNFYREVIRTAYPSLAHEYILGFSILGVFVIVFYLWRKEWEVEKARYEFVSIATHKFRTPLSGIKWSTEMLANDPSHEERQSILKQLRTAVDRLIEIVDLLVNFAKIDSKLDFAFQAASLREMVEEAMIKFGPKIKGKNIKFSINSDQSLPLIIIDKSKIQFAVDVIIDNAINYTPKDGSVTVNISKQDKSVRMSVKDTGMGMNWSDKRNLFKKFYRSKRAKAADTEGMGLGLYAAKQIIDRHGGKLWADSDGENKGSTFNLELKLGKNYQG